MTTARSAAELPAAMSLVRATPLHLREIQPWFPDARSCWIWGGPQFRHPFTEATFIEDTWCRELPSYALVDTAGGLLAFGQCYERVGRCHLGRLAVAPDRRGSGIGQWLVGGLAQIGTRQFGTDECSLFVVDDNTPALRLYERLGFVATPYPEDDPKVRPFVYMTVAARTLEPWHLHQSPGTPRIG